MTTLTLRELEPLFEAHASWWQTGGKEGAQLCLRDVSLESCVLAGVSLFGAVMENVRLVSCDLANARLSRSRLTNVTLVDCSLENARLNEAQVNALSIERSKCLGLDLSGARVDGFQAKGIVFEGAAFGKALLVRADLSGSDLSLVKLRRTDVEDSRLEGCNLSEANLLRATFTRCDLRDCDFRAAVIDGTRFDVVQLQGAKGRPDVFDKVGTGDVTILDELGRPVVVNPGESAALLAYLIR
jgi:uncharacterized protein YjbI with pentapeptide repeats